MTQGLFFSEIKHVAPITLFHLFIVFRMYLKKKKQQIAKLRWKETLKTRVRKKSSIFRLSVFILQLHVPVCVVTRVHLQICSLN